MELAHRVRVVDALGPGGALGGNARNGGLWVMCVPTTMALGMRPPRVHDADTCAIGMTDTSGPKSPSGPPRPQLATAAEQ